MTGRQVVWRSGSAEETYAVGEEWGRCLIGGVTIGLVGPLGAGKTQLVKGIAAGNAGGKAGPVTSPTFTLIHEYSGRLTLYHVDAYRLARPRDLTALGYDELAREDSAIVVEWADRVRSVMAADTLWVELTPTGENTRTLVVEAGGARSSRLLEALRRGDH